MEVSPNNLKGAMGAVHQLGLTGGILVAQILGLKDILGNAKYVTICKIWLTLIFAM